MAFEGKALDEITEAVLQELIDNKVPESVTLDYKSALSVNTEGEKKDFLKDVSAFANAAGGHLVYGIREEGRIPVELCGVDLPDPNDMAQRLRNIIRTGIEPVIHGYGVQPVGLAEGKTAIVVRVPKSFYPPHMVVLGGDRRFYTRSDSDSYPLDVPALRALFVGSETLTERIRNWRAERLAAILAGETPVLLGSGPKVVLHLAPFTAFGAPTQHDLSPAWKDASLVTLLGQYDDNPRWRHNFDGLLAVGRSADDEAAYLQVFRNGCIESAEIGMLQERKDTGPVVPTVNLEHTLLGCLRRYLSLLSAISAGPPIALMVSLLGVRGFKVAGPGNWRMYGRPIEKPDLLLPAALIDAFDVDPPTVLRPLFDVIWNAGGYERALSYDESGKWLGLRQ